MKKVWRPWWVYSIREGTEIDFFMDKVFAFAWHLDKNEIYGIMEQCWAVNQGLGGKIE